MEMLKSSESEENPFASFGTLIKTAKVSDTKRVVDSIIFRAKTELLKGEVVAAVPRLPLSIYDCGQRSEEDL